MPSDLFLSYARRDDEDGGVEDFSTQLRLKYAKFTGQEIEIFRDRTDLEFGEAWKDRITEESLSVPILLALLSPSYLKSHHCAFEWDLYRNRYQFGGVPSDVQVIIPIEFIDIGTGKGGDESSLELNDDQERRLAYAKQLHIGSWWESKFSPDEKDQFFHSLALRIKKLNLKLAPYKQRRRNTHKLNSEIDELAKRNDSGEWRNTGILIEKRTEQHAHPTVRPVCVIYTGGTVGMVRQERHNLNSDLVIGGLAQLEDHLPKLNMIPFDIHLFSYRQPIDSSAITPEDWVTLARVVRELYRFYQGFVILHGTNTMAYTASALSFMFADLSKPVILTGAELPLVDWHSDAEQNVIQALEIAAPYSERAVGAIPEVCIAFGNSLIRGNRATKYHSNDPVNAFYSPNYPVLGNIGAKHVDINYKVVRKIDEGEADRLEVRGTDLRHSVMILDVYPDFDLRHYSNGLDDKRLAGLIIRTYGSGNVPEKPGDLLAKLKELVDREVIIVNLTQCPMGRTELRLFETSARLFDIGVINGGDMTTEAAYTKLKVLLGKNLSKDEVRRLMQIDERGELTLSAYHIRYGEPEGPYLANPTFLGPSRLTDSFRFRSLDIDHAYLRIKGISVPPDTPDREIFVKFYYHVPDSVGIPSKEAGYRQIGEFVKTVTSGQTVSHNLEVTGKLRQLFRRDTHVSLQVHSESGLPLRFESLQLSVFTRE